MEQFTVSLIWYQFAVYFRVQHLRSTTALFRQHQSARLGVTPMELCSMGRSQHLEQKPWGSHSFSLYRNTLLNMETISVFLSTTITLLLWISSPYRGNHAKSSSRQGDQMERVLVVRLQLRWCHGVIRGLPKPNAYYTTRSQGNCQACYAN